MRLTTKTKINWWNKRKFFLQRQLELLDESDNWTENWVISCDGHQESKQIDQMSEILFTGVGNAR